MLRWIQNYEIRRNCIDVSVALISRLVRLNKGIFILCYTSLSVKKNMNDNLFSRQIESLYSTTQLAATISDPFKDFLKSRNNIITLLKKSQLVKKMPWLIVDHKGKSKKNLFDVNSNFW